VCSNVVGVRFSSVMTFYSNSPVRLVPANRENIEDEREIC
jgi:hypothetical protein